MTVLWLMKVCRKFFQGMQHLSYVDHSYRRGQYGQDIFTLPATYLEGRPPKSVNMYWRRFSISELPLDDHAQFDAWVQKIWREKDDLMEQYLATGRFPAMETLKDNGKDGEGRPLMGDGTSGGYIETTVKTKHWWEWMKIFVVLAGWGLVAIILARLWNWAMHRSMLGHV